MADPASRCAAAPSTTANPPSATPPSAAPASPSSASSPAQGPLWLVVNAASGSNSEESCAALVARLAAAGHEPARIVRFPDDALPGVAELDAAGVCTLAIFTGDGTINSQVRKLIDWTGTILILPGGTQNLLAKALHGVDCSVESIVEALAAQRMSPRALRAVQTSQGPALVEVLAGPGATWADVREGVRDLDLPTIASALGEAVRNTAAGALVRVVDPAVGKPAGYRALRVDAVAGPLTLDGYDVEGVGDVAAQGLAMLVKRDFRAGPHDELGTCERVTVESDAPIALMLDGERFDGGLSETFTAITLPVQFLGSSPRAGG
ncbi:diacylglycerol kinase family protein [Novosphingobium huizhouense]|uniref:diacylglycerol kinase family protein n=1 Tax=Novosphingobium huizhouense TaxID=2866625 RepID=UPI001CD8D291|nr:diacylglycerol kinase family protein [Novosphingobium huizhouense]